MRSTYELPDCVNKYMKIPEVYPRLMETSKMESFETIVNCKASQLTHLQES